MVHLGPAYPDDPSSGSTDTTTPKEDDLPTNNNNNNINNDNATATTEMIEEEDPATIPIDETAFTHPPHFSSTTPLHRSLRDLDLSYRCTICFELYNVPVSLYPCLHSFCSVCIRKNLKTQYASMKRKAECPMCNANLIGGGRGASGDYEKAILPNRELENRVDLYKMRVREELRRSLVRLDVLERRERVNNQGRNNSNDEEQPHQQQQSLAAVLSSAKRARRSTANYKREYSEQDDEETMTYNNNIDDSRASATTSAAPDTAVDTSVAAASSTCAASFHHHQPPPHQPLRKRKPTISYHGLKRKKLIELCSNENLSTSGSDTELKNRHSEFILLYNSQCDSQHPMSAQDVAAMVMKEEQNRKREAKIESSTNNLLLGNGLGSKQKVEGEMEKRFKQMIERLKKARKKKEDGDDDENEMKNNDTTNGSGGDDQGSGSIPSCIVAATATAAALMNGSTISGNNHASAASSKPRSAVSTAAAAAASSSASTSTIRSTAAAINEDVKSKKTTPSKSRRSTTTKTTTTATRGTSKQATISSSAKKKKSSSSSATTTTSGGVWKCLTCTFENHKFTRVNAICEMCSTPRPEKENTSNEVIAIDC